MAILADYNPFDNPLLSFASAGLSHCFFQVDIDKILLLQFFIQ